MNGKWLGFGGMGLCWALAASCAQDDREVSLVLPLFGEGGASIGGNAGDSAQPAEGAAGSSSSETPIDPMLLVPQLEVGPASIDLGWVTTGFPARARLVVSNSGSAPLPAPQVSWSADSDSDFELIQNQCLTDLSPGASCELRVQLVPSRVGALQATLHFQSQVGGVDDVALTGQGLQAGDLILAPVAGSFEDFGGVLLGERLEGGFSLSNPSDVSSGPLSFNLNRPEFSLLPAIDGDCVPGTTALVGGESCNLRVAFAPSERGPLEATLTSASDGVGSVSLTLAGRGLLPAALSASSPGVDFDGVLLGEGAQRSVTFENVGDEPLTLSGASLQPVDVEGFAIQNSDCGEGTVLSGGQTCSVLVEFRPPRTGEELTAELVAAGVDAAQTQTVALRGIGLEPGSLLVAPVSGGDSDFGDVLVGESLVRAFQVQNPGAQPSGVLGLLASEGFELVTPPEAGDCVAGETSLVDGESCTLRVSFTPLERRAVSGSLTITSPLSGAAGLPLTGRGIIAAALEASAEVNFGRVLTGASAERTLTIRNAGDQPLPPPTLELSGSSDAQVAAFSHESSCTQPLAFDEQCAIALSFAPTVAVAHSANLQLTSAPGGTQTVLLLGEAQVPGSLVLAAVAGSSADFGDVAIDTTASRSFTLTNPGAVPSGRLTITTDNNRFEPELGDCNQGDPAGLVDGSSCTFSVQFAPSDSLQVTANLSVQSPGAGRAGLQMRGRGRLPPTLAATGNRDMGRANIGQTVAQSDFTWTVNNQGDLPTGALSVQNLSTPVNGQPEFEIRNDTCSAAAVAGRSSCQMIISFRPGGTGTRTGRIVVTDPTGGSSAPLVLTGLGVQVAGPGQSCVNAECAQGVCTRGVCCDRACDRTCQECSGAGVCIDQSNQEACGAGNGAAACFGVDNCKLPEGQACSANNGDAQCGSGNCERRLGGSGNGDRICCLDDCGTTGQQCNAQTGRCQQPTLGAGAQCGRNGDLPCGGGLQCKSCPGTNISQCTPPDRCCGTCGAGLECDVAANSCACPVGPNGSRGIPCGGGLCAINRQDACCPNSPECNRPGLPVCDARDNLCKQCLDAGDCAPGPAGTRAQCTNNSCSYPCDFQNGFRSCNGICIAPNQCCQDTDCGNPCQACNTSTRTCGALGGRPDRCPGAQVCNGNSQCVQCTSGAQCGNGEVCTANACVPAGAPPGSNCSQDADCQANTCRNWSPDNDDDGFGEEGVIVRRCGPPGPGFVENDADCCDGDAQARPTQRGFLDRERFGCGGFDFDCDDNVDASPPVAVCSDFGAANCPTELSVVLSCGQPLTVASCLVTADGCLAVGARGLGTNQTCH